MLKLKDHSCRVDAIQTERAKCALSAITHSSVPPATFRDAVKSSRNATGTPLEQSGSAVEQDAHAAIQRIKQSFTVDRSHG
jgi:hypothetical protein